MVSDLVTKPQQSAASADVIQYPNTHEMVSVSTTLASSYSLRKEPPRPTFIFNSCNFSSCSMMFSRNDDCQNFRKNELDDLLEGITVEELFDC